jgi:hypothetical protein
VKVRLNMRIEGARPGMYAEWWEAVNDVSFSGQRQRRLVPSHNQSMSSATYGWMPSSTTNYIHTHHHRIPVSAPAPAYSYSYPPALRGDLCPVT